MRLRSVAVLSMTAAMFVGLTACGASSSGIGLGNCAITSAKGSLGGFKLTSSGVLTVATNLPAPGYWNGKTTTDQKDGLEFCLAADIANRLGLSKVHVVNVDFAALQAGQVKGYDIALSQMTILPERQKVVDFSSPYFSSDQGLMVLKGTTAATLADVKKLKLGSQVGTTGLDYANTQIKPNSATQVFQDTATMFNALLAKTVDGLIFDVAIVLPQTKVSGYENTAIIDQFKTGEGYGIVLPKGSPNLTKINDLLKAQTDDGTLARYSNKYVQVDPAEVARIPFITAP